MSRDGSPWLHKHCVGMVPGVTRLLVGVYVGYGIPDLHVPEYNIG